MKNFSVQYLLSHIDNKKDAPSGPSPPPTTLNTINVNSSDNVGKKIMGYQEEEKIRFCFFRR